MIDAVKTEVSDEAIRIIYGRTTEPTPEGWSLAGQLMTYRVGSDYTTMPIETGLEAYVQHRISAALAAQGRPVAVKALEWVEPTFGPDEYVTIGKADALNFHYRVENYLGKFEVKRSCDIQPCAWAATVETAKTAAQADYETRILSALNAPAQPVGVPVGYVSAVELYTLQQTDTCVDLFSTPPQDGFQFVPVYAAPQPPAEGGWKPIESAPVGKSGYSWMLLAYGPEGDQSVSIGMRFQDKFYAGGTFYVGGPFDQRQYGFKELEVTPSHWMPLPPAAANGGEQNG